MNSFRPEDHPEVGRDLDGLVRRVKERWSPEIGTSGSGEITLRFGRCTFYARKYRRKTGWRLTCRWPGGAREPRGVRVTDVDGVVDIINRVLQGDRHE